MQERKDILKILWNLEKFVNDFLVKPGFFDSPSIPENI